MIQGFYQLDISSYYPNKCDNPIHLLLDLYCKNNIKQLIEKYKSNNNFLTSTIKQFYREFIYISISINIIDDNHPYNYTYTIPNSILDNIGLIDRNIVDNYHFPFISYEQLYMIMLINTCHYQ